MQKLAKTSKVVLTVVDKLVSKDFGSATQREIQFLSLNPHNCSKVRGGGDISSSMGLPYGAHLASTFPMPPVLPWAPASPAEATKA